MQVAVADYTSQGFKVGTRTASYRVDHLSDAELIAGTRGLVLAATNTSPG